MATKVSVFADLEDLPTTMGDGEVYDAMNPYGEGVDLPAGESDREFKKIYDNQPMLVSTDGFTIFVSLNHNDAEEKGMNGGKDNRRQRTPKTYFKFTVGETPTYSFYFGEDAPFYNLMPESILVKSIKIDKTNNKTSIDLTDGEVTISPKVSGQPRFKFSWANPMGTNGFMGQVITGYAPFLYSVTPYDAKTVSTYADAFKAQNEGATSAMADAIKDMNERGEGLYMWDADSPKVYVSPQSFSFDEELSKDFLLPPSVEFSDKNVLDTKDSYIKFSCLIEKASLRTDNYTGRDSENTSDIFICSLQFPGDESLLAPMGTSEDGTTVPCGADSAEGRVLKSITPAMNMAGTAVQEVKLEFHDGSHYIFPNSETGMFTAKDKDTGQELQGKVKNLIVAQGLWKEAYATEVANRLERNSNTSFNTINTDGKVVTSAIAWGDGSMIKVIVPTEKGSKLITLPLRKKEA